MHSSVVFGDIDNDGDSDIIISGCSGGGATTCTTIGKTRVYENNGTSFNENSTWQQNLTNASWSSLAFGDIDNDGDLDLALTGYDGFNGITKIYENNGTSFNENSTWQQNLTGTNTYQGAVAFGDIDNDGDLDLCLVGADSANENGIYINNGTSFVKSSTWLESLPKVGQGLGKGAIVFGDFDNNNLLDLIMLGSYGTNFYRQAYINNGTSLIENLVWENFDNVFGWPSLSLGDFDNDNDLDLSCIGTRVGDHFYIIANNGTGFEENQTESGPLVGIFDGSLSFGDYDNDGDLDLAGLGKEAGRAVVYLNNNTKYDIDETAHSNISNYLIQGALAWGDIDNDFNLDLIVVAQDAPLSGSSYIAKVYTNNLTDNPNEQPTPPIQFTNYTTTDGNIHLGWGNGSDNETTSNGLYYNLRVGSTSQGNQIISGKYGGGEDNGYFGNMLQRKNITLKSTRLQTNTVYYWSVQTIDTGLRTSAWSAEQNFTTLGDLTTPAITLNSPVNNYNTSTPQLNITFNATVSDNINVTNVSLYGNWTGSFVINQTNSSGYNTSMSYLFNVNLSGYSDGYYIWEIKACDNSSLCTISENRTFSIDTAYPIINLISPSNDSTLYSNSVSFQYNVTDLHISNCSLIIGGSIQETDYSIQTDAAQEISTSLGNGAHNWNINCTDEVNHQNTSLINKLTVSYQPSTGGVSKSSSNRRASTRPSRLIESIPKPELKPIKPQDFREKLEKITEPKEEAEKPAKKTSLLEIIYGFIVSLFMILGYVWIIKEDFKR